VSARLPATVVFGEALVDDFGTEQLVGGAPFNVARHLAAFLEPQLMITRIGDDGNGAVVRAEFERFAMLRAGLQVDPLEETGRVLVERGPQGHRFSILPGQAYDYIDADAAVASLATVEPATLYFGTLAQRGAVSSAALAALLAAVPANRFLDLNLRADEYELAGVTRSLQAANIVKVNEEELQVLFGWYCRIDKSEQLAVGQVHAACRSLLEMFSLDGLVVTMGHRGSAWFGADGGTLVNRDNPAPPFVIDTVGAGDAFAAILLLGRARGWALATTLARANEFAGAICAIPGAMPRDLGFYDKWVARWRAG
jgi:fructokinase